MLKEHCKRQKHSNLLRLTSLPSPLSIQLCRRIIVRQDPHQMRRLLEFREAFTHLGEEGRGDLGGEDRFAGSGYWFRYWCWCLGIRA